MYHRRTLIAGAAAAVLCSALPATAQQATTDTLEISGGFARATPPMARVGAGFLTIRSLGPADRLVGFSTPACNRPELHTHIAEGDVMQMRRIEAIEVPAGGVARLEPGGAHLMMIDLNAPLEEGGTVALTLVFETAGEVPVEVPVLGIGAMGPGEG
ncbi:MAG: copper chaperone PCu(A)C [Paracoccaceae bacterium]